MVVYEMEIVGFEWRTRLTLNYLFVTQYKQQWQSLLQNVATVVYSISTEEVSNRALTKTNCKVKHPCPTVSAATFTVVRLGFMLLPFFTLALPLNGSLFW